MALMSKKTSTIYLIVSFILLSVGQPIFQSQLDRIAWDTTELQFHLTRADIWNLEGSYHTDMGNLILASGNLENDQMKFLYQYHREQATTDMRIRLHLLYMAFNDRIPDSSLTNKWSKMTLEELQQQTNSSYFLQYDFSKKARHQTRLWTVIKYLIYGLAVLLYTMGMIGIHTAQSKTKSS